MKLRALYPSVTEHTLVLTGGITFEEFFPDRFRSGGYYFINMTGSEFNTENHLEKLLCSTSKSLHAEEDSVPDTDIIFQYAGKPVHLDFDEILPTNQFVVLTVARNTNPETNTYSPFEVSFAYA